MNLFSAPIQLLFLTLACAAAGCVTSERDVIRTQDLTLEVIQQASSLFVADKELSAFPLQIDGFHGAMRLKGTVSNPIQKERAGRLVWSLRGVNSVQNEIAIQGAPAR